MHFIKNSEAHAAMPGNLPLSTNHLCQIYIISFAMVCSDCVYGERKLNKENHLQVNLCPIGEGKKSKHCLYVCVFVFVHSIYVNLFNS